METSRPGVERAIPPRLPAGSPGGGDGPANRAGKRPVPGRSRRRPDDGAPAGDAQTDSFAHGGSMGPIHERVNALSGPVADEDLVRSGDLDQLDGRERVRGGVARRHDLQMFRSHADARAFRGVARRGA